MRKHRTAWEERWKEMGVFDLGLQGAEAVVFSLEGVSKGCLQGQGQAFSWWPHTTPDFPLFALLPLPE